jgi:glycine cleavage system transcriptional repressor
VSRVVVTAVGADRPGIVAAVTKVFVDHGCNLEDCSMTILAGQFTMMLVIGTPAGLAPDRLEAALGAPAAALDLVVACRPLAEPGRREAPPGVEARWTVSVYGADRPGIVHRVAELLAAEQVNIVDLSTRVIGGADRPVYAMILEVSLPAAVDTAALERRLHQVAADLGVDASLHPSDADIL